MPLDWTPDTSPMWDADKRRVLGAAPAGSLPDYDMADGTAAPGDWYRVERNGEVVGFGWMDTVWGDAEVLLAVDPAHHGHGVGTFILEHLEAEAAKRGLGRIYNTVTEAHPQRQQVMAWLGKRGFTSRGAREHLERQVRRAQ